MLPACRYMRELLSALRVTPDGGSADVLDNALSSAEPLVRSQPPDLRKLILITFIVKAAPTRNQVSLTIIYVRLTYHKLALV